ncbi:hypothetical protein JTE90_012425 [Oedothorax gibbosus]|uniref:Uncharacterized protein n=1 Tax=Oedothorax gibbosus TaxID=931172 RepID=A0AAV6TG29_9ARAC|nr:hypothetical protein JTE90_012425 [Oedothorax gibbosus]
MITGRINQGFSRTLSCSPVSGKAFPPSRATHHQRALYLICPKNIAINKIRKPSHSGRRARLTRAPRCILQRGEKNKGRKGRQASRVGHAHGIQLTPPQPDATITISPYSHRNNFREERHGRGPGPSQEAETGEAGQKQTL